MRQYLLIATLLIGGAGTAQNGLSARMRFGINRIGVLSELGVEYKMGRHAIDFGFRLYEPDLVFVKDLPGAHLGYLFDLIDVGKSTVKLGVGIGFFYEPRETTNLLLINPSLRLRLERQVFERFAINVQFGTGPAINRVEIIPSAKKEQYTYMNYEATFGIAYRLWSPARD